MRSQEGGFLGGKGLIILEFYTFYESYMRVIWGFSTLCCIMSAKKLKGYTFHKECHNHKVWEGSTLLLYDEVMLFKTKSKKG